MKKYTKKEIRDKVYKLDTELKLIRPNVLELYEKITKERGESRSGVHSLNGLIMSKNSTKGSFTDLVNSRFSCFEEYLSKWLKSLKYRSKEWEDENIKYNPYKKYLLRELISYKEIKEYIIKQLEKNFYDKYNERIRFKPDESIWELWFGDTNMFWGLFITPRFRNGTWENDKSEIRRVKFEYWTIGHILSIGLINPDTNKIKKFAGVDELIDFYENILRHNSNSKYEKEIYDKYINYLKASEDILREPLLIPELRFGGLSKKHKYRIDFTIFNPYTEEYIGFELSPQSSHMSVSGKDKKLVEHNSELQQKWEKEVGKRNDFFEKNKISIITFSDSHLENIDKCFNVIKKYLHIKKIEILDIDGLIDDLIDEKDISKRPSDNLDIIEKEDIFGGFPDNFDLGTFISKLKENGAKGALTMALRGSKVFTKEQELLISPNTKIARTNIENTDNINIMNKTIIDMGLSNLEIKVI